MAEEGIYWVCFNPDYYNDYEIFSTKRRAINWIRSWGDGYQVRSKDIGNDCMTSVSDWLIMPIDVKRLDKAPKALALER